MNETNKKIITEQIKTVLGSNNVPDGREHPGENEHDADFFYNFC